MRLRGENEEGKKGIETLCVEEHLPFNFVDEGQLSNRWDLEQGRIINIALNDNADD